MSQLAGSGALIRLILRRDRIKLLIWVVLVGLVPIGMAASFAQLYPTAEAMRAFVDTNRDTPATIGVLGHIYSPNVGAVTAWRSGLNGVFLIVPVTILLIVRYTRSEEAAGRRELMASTVVGRYAPLTAALVVVLGANLAIGGVIAGGLIGLGLPVAGSLTLGLSAAFAGWTFAALAALVAQVTESPGAARGIPLAVLALFWVMRGVGDLSDATGLAWLSWLSPLGWVRLTRAFAGEQWWVFGLFVGLTSVMLTGACLLQAGRDLGAGLLPQRPGPANASASLRSPLALAWRLHQRTLIAWSAGAALLGSLLGSVGMSLSRFVDSPLLQDWVVRMGARDAGDAFLFMVMYVLGQAISAYAIVATLQMRSEEVEGRADPVLATPVSRLRWAGSHLLVAVAGPAILLAVLGLSIGLAFGLGAGDVGRELPRLLARTMVTLPAVWVMAGLAMALYGLLPRFATAATWAVFTVFILLEMGWELQQVSQAIFNISPFAHVHWALQVTAAPLVGLTAVAAMLATAGLFGFQRRDVG